jgi:hypothetical protein
MTSINKSVFGRLILSSLLGACLLGSSGCFRAAVLMPTVPPGEHHTTWVNGWLWGSVGGTISADVYCQGRGVARIETKRSVGNILVSWATLGIYTPSHVAVTCGNPAGYYAPPAPAPYGGGYGGYGDGYGYVR